MTEAQTVARNSLSRSFHVRQQSLARSLAGKHIRTQRSLLSKRKGNIGGAKGVILILGKRPKTPAETNRQNPNAGAMRVDANFMTHRRYHFVSWRTGRGAEK